MGVEGYAVAIVVGLVLCIVLPALLRRREVLAEARIDERYAEELRMLDVKEPETYNHADDSHGTIFFRQPEVIMSQSDKAPTEKSPVGDVRALARDRARRKARMSKRNAHRRLGYAGGGVLGAFAALAWILTATTTIPVAVPIVVSVLLGGYLVALSYVTNAMAQADAADRKVVTSIDKRLGGLRRGEKRGTTARAARATADAPAGSEEVGAVDSVTVAPESDRAQAADASRVQPSTGTGETRDKADAAEVTIGRAAGGVTAASTADGQAGASARGSATRDGAARRAERGAEVAEPVRRREVVEADVPSYTLKPRAFARRTVAPYAPPETAAAPVPYRPKAVGERFDEANAEVSESTHVADGLGGGATLDQMLNRRRA